MPADAGRPPDRREAEDRSELPDARRAVTPNRPTGPDAKRSLHPTNHLTPLPGGNTEPPEQSGREAEHLLGVIRRSYLNPAALARNQYRLCAIGGADLAVDVVEVGPNGARREPHLLGDLLVDLSLGQSAERIDLAT